MSGTRFLEELRHLPLRLCDRNISSGTCCIPGARLPCFLPGRHDLSVCFAFYRCTCLGCRKWRRGWKCSHSPWQWLMKNWSYWKSLWRDRGHKRLFVWWQLLNQVPRSHSRKSVFYLKWWFSSVLKTPTQLWSGQIQLKGLPLTKSGNSKFWALRGLRMLW